MPTFHCSECGGEFFERSEMAGLSPCQLCGCEDSVDRVADEPSVPSVARPASEDQAEPYRAAAALLRELKLSEPPIDVESIARQVGLAVSLEMLGNVDGELRDGNIRVNSAHSRVRRRFTIAHELGHLRMHTSHGPRGSEVERQANAFAGALLMPPLMLANAVKEGLGMTELRCRFDVSGVALSIALARGRLTAKVSGP